MDRNYTADQLQAAKDYLWEHLEQASRDIILHVSNTNTMADNGLTVDRLSINRNIIVGFHPIITRNVSIEQHSHDKKE